MLGVVVLIVAILALRNPHTTGTAAGTDTRATTPSAPASTATSPSASTGKSGSHSGGHSGPKSGANSGAGSGAHSGTNSGSGSTAPASASSAIGSQPLIVLNDTSTADLAQQAAQRFEGAGWNVTSYDENYCNEIASTVAYYDPGVAGAKRAAEALQRQFPTIKRVAPRFAPAAGGDPLPSGPVVVVLTTDYTPG